MKPFIFRRSCDPVPRVGQVCAGPPGSAVSPGESTALRTGRPAVISACDRNGIEKLTSDRKRILRPWRPGAVRGQSEGAKAGVVRARGQPRDRNLRAIARVLQRSHRFATESLDGPRRKTPKTWPGNGRITTGAGSTCSGICAIFKMCGSGLRGWDTRFPSSRQRCGCPPG